MENEIIEIKQAEVIQHLERAEVDVQISTAMRYPMHKTRDQINDIVEQITTIATLDPETAESCFYVMQRGRGADAKTIEGVSVRFAEIVAHSWGNLRIQTRIVGNDGRFVTAQAICHDLEKNVAYSATTQEVLNYLGVKSQEGIDREMLFNLLGLVQAIKEGDTTIQEAFRANRADSTELAEKAKKEAENRRKKVDAAMAKGTGKGAAQAAGEADKIEVVDEASGEVLQPGTAIE